jgi:hypothetical protein
MLAGRSDFKGGPPQQQPWSQKSPDFDGGSSQHSLAAILHYSDPDPVEKEATMSNGVRGTILVPLVLSFLE